MAETLFAISIERKKRRYEKPQGVGNFVFGEDLGGQLPTPALHQGYKLRFVEYFDSRDPVILYDKNYKIVHEWGYVPSLTEVFELCESLFT